MPRIVKPLSPVKCDAHRYNPEGGNKLADGGGLYLEAMPNGRKSWRMKYIRPEGKEDRLVFGDYPAVSLKVARAQREEAKGLLAQGIDPKAQQRADAARLKQDHDNTFEAVARQWHKIMSASPKWSPDYAETYLRRMEAGLFPDLGRRPIAGLKTRDLIQPIRKIEKKGTSDIAERMQMAICGIFKYAVQEGLIEQNPSHDLVGCIAPRKTKHRPSLPLDRLPELLGKIDSYGGYDLTRLAMQMKLLVFIRSSELRFARWEEIDLDRALWTVPEKREAIERVKHSTRGAKMKETHLVPLSRQAVATLKQLQELTDGEKNDLVFPGTRNHWRPISENTINKALRIMGYGTDELCGHGFRTMACGALIQSGLWQEDAVERQMSHKERNSVRLAYSHAAEFLQERRLMMQWWADYLDANRPEHVTPFDYAHPELGAQEHASTVLRSSAALLRR